ncbi:glycosyltransferase family 39 protein [Granulicella mallensis]|uniref:4-amino-4-deoxy-L-arabinose transferase-like glycosyltransferase n=1 Tax=Granulicella mallensis TaxID=940614 RepID=A0A7W7ZUI4_9BACT|nr:glycosyltransferase family 39 protein [Granulicella mallensis]MBB5066414.1 4-amino-4-deoxy-L-arabinose transferase-like glycosyltransferase [Granulicella mallensis]
MSDSLTGPALAAILQPEYPSSERKTDSPGAASLQPGTPKKHSQENARWPLPHLCLLLGLWIAIFAASLWTPPLLDDADATHAQAAQAMVHTGDWVTLHVDGIRYLEKPPLPYWLVAISLRLFGAETFAVHLPIALAVLGLALLGYAWSKRVFDSRTALYTGIFTLTSAGIFLFTRIFIPEVLLSLFLCLGLYSLQRALDSGLRRHAYTFWVALALAVLTKGLIAIVFVGGVAMIYLTLTGQWRQWRQLRPFSGLLLFLLIASPWHILASLRNTGGSNGHGFFWFYFINEHVLRFLGRRVPRDYNKLPGYLYWSLHLVWLFPWSLFAPVALIAAWRRRSRLLIATTETQRTTLLLVLYSGLILLFFSLSTNQEYYTFPVYLPLLMLLAATLVRAEQQTDRTLGRAITSAHAAFAVIGLAVAIALGFGLWTSRHMAFVPDIGDLLAHRGVGDYTLSMSHFFDLTGASFAALRLPATLAALAFAIGPVSAWMLRVRSKHVAATLAMALTSAVFLIAAHIALVRFSPMLSSQNFAARIQSLERNGNLSPTNQVLLYGDQAYGSSIPFYLDRQVMLVDGRSTSMLFGSTFPDAPPIFLTHEQLLAQWGTGPRKLLFVPAEKRDEVDRLLGKRQIVLDETSGKALVTDRPLDRPQPVDSQTPDGSKTIDSH